MERRRLRREGSGWFIMRFTGVLHTPMNAYREPMPPSPTKNECGSGQGHMVRALCNGRASPTNAHGTLFEVEPAKGVFESRCRLIGSKSSGTDCSLILGHLPGKQLCNFKPLHPVALQRLESCQGHELRSGAAPASGSFLFPPVPLNRITRLSTLQQNYGPVKFCARDGCATFRLTSRGADSMTVESSRAFIERTA